MAFTDTALRKVLQGWGLDHVLLGEAVAVGDPVGVNATNEWMLASAGATPHYLARYVAAEGGAAGDTVAVFRMAILEGAFGATLADYGDPLYLADTAGNYTAAAGTVRQNVGWVNDATHILVELRSPLALDASDIGDDSIDSQHYAADSIDTEHYAPGSVDGTAIAADAVTSTHLLAGGVDTTAIATNVYGIVCVTIQTGSSDTVPVTEDAYAPVAGDVVAVQFMNSSSGTMSAAAGLTVGSYQTACAESGATMIAGAVFRDTTMNSSCVAHAVGATLLFTSGEVHTGTEPQTCIVEIRYQIKLVT